MRRVASDSAGASQHSICATHVSPGRRQARAGVWPFGRRPRFSPSWWFNVTTAPDPQYVLISRPSGNLLGEFRTLDEAKAVRAQYVALDARNAEAIEIVYDDGTDEPASHTLSRAS
jgi:hypothetical protein